MFLCLHTLVGIAKLSAYLAGGNMIKLWNVSCFSQKGSYTWWTSTSATWSIILTCKISGSPPVGSKRSLLSDIVFREPWKYNPSCILAGNFIVCDRTTLINELLDTAKNSPHVTTLCRTCSEYQVTDMFSNARCCTLMERKHHANNQEAWVYCSEWGNCRCEFAQLSKVSKGRGLRRYSVGSLFGYQQ